MTNDEAYLDQELSQRIKAGEHHAFNELHHRYYAVMMRYAYSLIADREVCEDMLQDIFSWFWEHREQHNIRTLKAYLLTAVRFQAAKFIRKGKVREAHLLSLSNDNSFRVAQDSLEVKELRAIISSFINALPEKCGEIFRLSRVEHMTNKEIAAKLGISETTVAVQIKRALDKFKLKVGKINALTYFFI